jgi:hypothetical protein
MKDNEVLITALRGVLSMCRTEGRSRAELKTAVDEVCNHKPQTQNEREEEWISVVQNLMDNGYGKEWAIRQAGLPPRKGMEDEI